MHLEQRFDTVHRGPSPETRHTVQRLASMPYTRTANIPHTGDLRRMSRRLAVGNPKVRPSSWPWLTRPTMR
jgi:hypothetical protein